MTKWIPDYDMLSKRFRAPPKHIKLCLFIGKTSKSNLEKETLPLDKYTIYMKTTAHGKPLSCLMINLHESSIVA